MAVHPSNVKSDCPSRVKCNYAIGFEVNPKWC